MEEKAHARQLVVFTLAGEQYALPITQIQEIVRYTQPRSVASGEFWIRGVVNLRGRIVPIYDLAARLQVDSEVTEQTKIVIIDTGSQTVGVTVDGVDEVLTIDETQIESAPGADPTLIESIAKIDERLVVMLDPSTIFGGLQPLDDLADAA
jgi:purine-binding chemotaxis protein CheW